MKDAEIIKTLEYCTSDSPSCSACKYDSNTFIYGKCMDNLMRDALDLINRQKKEIERLKYLLDYEEKQYDLCAKRFFKEGVKEFAERLKNSFCISKEYLDVMMIINNLLAEMESERE